jgi:hypothetical protein
MSNIYIFLTNKHDTPLYDVLINTPYCYSHIIFLLSVKENIQNVYNDYDKIISISKLQLLEFNC